MNESLREALGILYPFLGATGAAFWCGLFLYLAWLGVMEFIKGE